MFQMAHNGKRQLSENGTVKRNQRNPQQLQAETTENVKFFRC